MGASALSYSDYQSGTCRLAETEFITIGCKPVGDPIPVSEIFKPGETRSFRVELSGASITSSTPAGQNIYRLRDSAGAYICGPQGGSNDLNCNGVALKRGQTYTASAGGCLGPLCPPNIEIKYSGRPVRLVMSAPQVGLVEIPIPGSSNCIVQDITNSGLTGSQLNQIDASASRSLGLSQEGDAQPYARGYREKPGIISYFHGDQKTPAFCDQFNKKVTAYTKTTGMGGQCWAFQDGAQILFDGRNEQFCCSDSVCSSLYGLGPDTKCVNNVCQRAAQGNVQCNVASDCSFSDQYIETLGGKTLLRTAACVNNQCTTKDTEIACNPSRAYPNNQCCKLDVAANKYALTTCDVPLRACDTLGADACCLATQSGYTVRTPPEGKVCCDADKDGLGQIRDTCSPVGATPACKLEGQTVSSVIGESCCDGLFAEGGIFGQFATCKKSQPEWVAGILAVLLGLIPLAALYKKNKVQAIALGLIVAIIAYLLFVFIAKNLLLVLIATGGFLYLGGASFALAVAAYLLNRK